MAKTENTNANEAKASGYVVPTAKEIEALKAKHGELFKLTVTDREGNEHVAILRKPKFTDLQRAKASENKKPLTFNLSIWENCKVEGDPMIDADDYLKSGAISQIDEIVEFADATVKKL